MSPRSDTIIPRIVQTTAKPMRKAKSEVTVDRAAPLRFPSMIRYLRISAALEIGFTLAMALSQAGIAATGSSALLANRSGNPRVLPTAARVSNFLALTASMRKTQRKPMERRVKAVKTPRRSNRLNRALKIRPPGKIMAINNKMADSTIPLRMLESSKENVMALRGIGEASSLLRYPAVRSIIRGPPAHMAHVTTRKQSIPADKKVI